MRRIVACRQFVPELVHGKVLPAPELGKTAVRHTAAPHELAHRIVVLAADEEAAHALHDDADQLLGNAVGEDVRLLDAREVAFHRVHHDVRRPRCNLLTRQSKGERGVHKGDDGTVQRCVQPALLPRILVREHRRVARLAARRGDREHRAKGHGLCELLLARPDVPDVGTGVCNAVCDRLCRINDAAAADGKNEVDIGGKSLADRLTHERDARIRTHAAHDEERQSLRGQIFLNAREQPRTLRAAAAVEDEHAARPERAQFPGDRILRIPSEDDLGRAVIGKALHENPPHIRMNSTRLL